jgi:hypothetical protein
VNEEPKSIWKKSWRGTGSLLLAWLGLMIATLIIFLIITLAAGARITSEELKLWLALSLCATTVIFLALFIRWLFCWRNLKRTLFALACLATLIALIYAEEDWRGWHAWNKFKHEWEAKGEKFDFASIVPPPVPDDQNFAMAPIWAESIKATLGPVRARQWKYPDDGRTNFTDRMPTPWRNNDWFDSKTNGDWAKGTITDLKPWQAYYRTPTEMKLSSRKSVTTNEFPITPQPQTPAQDVLLALSKFDPAVEELRQASRLPYSRFPLDYDSENPAVILLPHLALLKRSSQVLQLRAIAELQSGQSEKALDDVKLMLRLTDAVRTEPPLISHLVRIAMLQITLQPVYEGLAEHRWSDAQLDALNAELAKQDLLADCQNVQKSEIFFSAEEANYLRRHRDYANQFAQWGFSYSDSFKFKFAIYRYMPGGWFYQSALKNGRTQMQYLPAVNHDTKTISPALVRRADAAANNAVSFFDPLDSLKKMFGADFQFMGNFLEKIAAGQSSVDLARVAIALERYRLAHGEYPESLDSLAPQFMAKVPRDVIGGQPSQGSGSASQPLHYRRTADGQFVLYSVGWNERDDGGVVVNQKSRNPRDESGNTLDISQGDWVWRYPAK